MKKVATYQTIQSDIAELLRQARLTAVRSVNSLMTATYWEVGRPIVERFSEKPSRKLVIVQTASTQFIPKLKSQKK